MQDRATQQSAGQGMPGPSAMGGSRWFMYDILKGGGELTSRCERSRIDCRTINAVWLCGVHERSCDYVNEGDQQVCETTCLDIVGGLFEMRCKKTKLDLECVMQDRAGQARLACVPVVGADQSARKGVLNNV